jgi:hypothetical protein
VDARLWHNGGPSGYTLHHRPWRVVVSLEFPDEQAAINSSDISNQDRAGPSRSGTSVGPKLALRRLELEQRVYRSEAPFEGRPHFGLRSPSGLWSSRVNGVEAQRIVVPHYHRVNAR